MDRPIYHVKTPLTEAQQVSCSRMVKKKHFICVEKAGKGKTLAILASFIHLYNLEKIDTLLVLTPKNAYEKKVWPSEAKQHTNIPTIDIEEIQRRAGNNHESISKIIKQYPVIYCKHSHVHKLDDIMKIIQLLSRCAICWDEIHKLKNPTSRLTLNNKLMALKAFARWGLTASPLSKDLKDCYNIINFIKPWYFGTFEQFRKEFCTTRKVVIGRNPMGGLREVEEITGILNEQAFRARIFPIVITGNSIFDLKWHYIEYEMGTRETKLYHKLAKGVFSKSLDMVESAQEWFKAVMGLEEKEEEQYSVKEVSRHSSRFLYLQFAADGIIAENGDIGTVHGLKCDIALGLLRAIAARGESTIMYFSYYASLDTIETLVRKHLPHIKIIKTTGKNSITPDTINEAKVKQAPYLILATKAGSESSSFYYINNVILFHIPTTPETFTQIVGRITRIDTLFPENLNVHIFKSDNIDLYKFGVVCHKAYQAELVVGEEKNIPDQYKVYFKSADVMALCKKYLLWNQQKSSIITNAVDNVL